MDANILNLKRLVYNPTARKAIYRAVRKAHPGVKALCAATASEYLARAGVLTDRYTWTADLSDALESKGWPRTQDVAKLHELSAVFTVDANNNDAPDHVYLFLTWLDRAKWVALILDNYQADPHARNVLTACWYKARRLARGHMAYALCPPAS